MHHVLGQILICRLQQGAKAFAWYLSTIGLIVTLLWAGIGLNLWHDHAAAEQDAAKDTANLAQTFDENITRTVEAVDQTLLFTREAYRHDPSGLLVGSWAKAHAFLDDLHMQISLVDRNGVVVWSNLGAVPRGTSVADRAHFLAQKDSPDDALFISGPVLGRMSGKWTIPFTRKLLAPDGSFDGIAAVSLDPAYLSRFYRSISIGNGSILLATTDGTVLARAPGYGTGTGDELPPMVMTRLMRGTTSGAFRTVSVIDHVERIFSARRVERYPLVLSVGLATKDVFAVYNRNKRLYLAVGIMLSLTGIMAGVFMVWQRRSVIDSRKALAVTLEHMSQGIAMVRADGSIPVLNHRAIQLLGLPSVLLARRPTLSADHRLAAWRIDEFGDPASWDAHLERVVRGGRSQHGDYTYERTRPNGTVLEVRTQGCPTAASCGRSPTSPTGSTTRRRWRRRRSRAAHAERMQALGQLAGGIAHDFNNILQSVQGGATLIDKRAADPDSVRRFARMILDATERGTSITRRLLAFARRGELRAEPVEPGPAVGAARRAQPHAGQRHRGRCCSWPPDLPPLLADKGQLETALVNLATNARDAMPDGGTLTLVRRGRNGGGECAPPGRSAARGTMFGCRSPIPEPAWISDAGPGAGTVLFDQTAGQGHRPGSVDGQGLRRTERRRPGDRQPPGRGTTIQPVAAGGDRGGRGVRVGRTGRAAMERGARTTSRNHPAGRR